jgi:hypothetical protein
LGEAAEALLGMGLGMDLEQDYSHHRAAAAPHAGMHEGVSWLAEKFWLVR